MQCGVKRRRTREHSSLLCAAVWVHIRVDVGVRHATGVVGRVLGFDYGGYCACISLVLNTWCVIERVPV
eukprot:3419051-Rhodomonas_salina.1